MPKIEGDPWGGDLQRRLRAELDRVQPPFSSPRYLTATKRPLTWRLAPVALAASVVGILALSAFAATGSANPVVWTEHVVTVIHPSPSSPTPQSSPDEHRGGAATTPSQAPAHKSSPEPTQGAEPSERQEPAESPEPTERPESAESPEPSGDHSGDGSSGHSGSGSGGSGGSSSSPRPSDD